MTTPTTPSLAQTRRDPVFEWVGLLYVLPGFLLLLIGLAPSIFSASPITFLSPVNRLGFALCAAGLWLWMVTVEVVRRLSPSWRVVLAEREARAVRHPRRLRLAQWWGFSVGALAFALLAIAPAPVGAWLGAGIHPLAFFAYLYSALAIAWAPLLLLYRFDRVKRTASQQPAF